MDTGCLCPVYFYYVSIVNCPPLENKIFLQANAI